MKSRRGRREGTRGRGVTSTIAAECRRAAGGTARLRCAVSARGSSSSSPLAAPPRGRRRIADGGEPRRCPPHAGRGAIAATDSLHADKDTHGIEREEEDHHGQAQSRGRGPRAPPAKAGKGGRAEAGGRTSPHRRERHGRLRRLTGVHWSSGFSNKRVFDDPPLLPRLSPALRESGDGNPHHLSPKRTGPGIGRRRPAPAPPAPVRA